MCINIHTCTSSVLPRILLRRSGRVCICHVHKQHIQMFNINAPVNVYLHYFPPRLPKVHCVRPGDLTSLSLRLFQVVLLFLVLDSSKDHVDGWNYQQPSNTSQSDSCHQNVCTSLHVCSIQTTEDAENVEIAKSTQAGDQKQKYNLEWPIK